MRHPAVISDFGCGCRRPKLSTILSFLRPKPRHSTTAHSLSSSSSLLAPGSSSAAFTNSASHSSSSPHERRRRRSSSSRKTKRASSAAAAEGESVAVVKESTQPYADFRESLMQMIVEEELYSWDDLNDLLHRFYSLNSPRHHHLILCAFADLLSGDYYPPCTWETL
ncbi:hypothetical protein HPP92_011622 [Vanilla planifolia]|uniref:Transcription repressor n=1 Tax=Vanilla planifolia TaxID=51239 RepID=A0A835QYI5_VANPL|nr:hypothetical protein HPP92_011912 [Vanilla planifolia]KAG0483538.1 hypothetical protein HPP92_011622 [Vanilla planifolia]